jgi:branched-chain amino acid transport system substrate-binding protein
MNPKTAAVAVLALSAGLAAAQNATGVGKDELLIGTILDLSGPLAGYGKQMRSGMQMRVDEANEMGGVNGRRIRLIIEDSGYDPKKAVLAAHKLADQDGVFAVIGHLGSAQNMAAMPVLFGKNVINFFPASASRDTYEPLHRLKYAFMPANFDQMRIGAARLMKERGLKRACTLYQDDDYGLEVMRGAEAGLKGIGTDLIEKTTYKRGATDFSSQVARLKAANCELVVLGTVIRETVGAISEGRKTGFNPVYIGPNAIYTDLIPRLGGKAVDGLYATMTAQHPYVDDTTQELRLWAVKYRTRFNEDPAVFSAYGYSIADSFLKGAYKAGPSLSTESFLKAMDTTVIPRDVFGSAEASFSASKRLGNPYPRLSQLTDGKWKVVSDYVAFNGLSQMQQKDGRVKAADR